jgi:hypothetical protein
MQHSQQPNPTTQDGNAPWYRNQAAALSILFLTLINCIGVLAFYEGQMEIKLTSLNLRPEGCNVLKHSGIVIQPLDNGSCKVQLPYRTNMMGSGGRIELGSTEISVSDNQVIATVPIANQPYTVEQSTALKLLIISAALMLVVLGWVINLQAEAIADKIASEGEGAVSTAGEESAKGITQ